MMNKYMIVTNDEYELPVRIDVIGIKACAEFMGVTYNYILSQIHNCGRWRHQKYKVIPDGPAPKKQPKKTDRTEYFKQYYKEHRHIRQEYCKKYYIEHRHLRQKNRQKDSKEIYGQ